MVTSTKRWKYVVSDMSRHGQRRYYLRIPGQLKQRLPGPVGSPEFEAAYLKATGGKAPDQRARPPRSQKNTIRWLCEQYFASTPFKTLDKTTRSKRRPILEAICQEPLSPDDPDPIGNCPIVDFVGDHVQVLRDRKITTPEAANARVKVLRRLFVFAIENKPQLAKTNPARDVPLVQTNSEGHHTWTIAEVERYIERHPLGTKAYKMLALLLFTGVRISDAALIGRQHETKSGKLVFTAFKNRNKMPVKIDIPILPVLREALDAFPSTGLHYLETEHGKPHTIKGLGNWFRHRCDEAGLQHCSAHGLRKAGATIAAENGASDSQLMAIFGWSDHRQPSKYTQKAQRSKMAQAGMRHLELPEGETEE